MIGYAVLNPMSHDSAPAFRPLASRGKFLVCTRGKLIWRAFHSTVRTTPGRAVVTFLQLRGCVMMCERHRPFGGVGAESCDVFLPTSSPLPKGRGLPIDCHVPGAKKTIIAHSDFATDAYSCMYSLFLVFSGACGLGCGGLFKPRHTTQLSHTQKIPTQQYTGHGADDNSIRVCVFVCVHSSLNRVPSELRL